MLLLLITETRILIVLSARSDGVCIIISFVGAPVGITGTIFTLMFPLTTVIMQHLPSITTKKKKKRDKILMLTKSKINFIKTLVSQTLIGMEIIHEEFITIMKKTDKYEKMKENLRNVSEKLDEKTDNMRLNNANSRDLMKITKL